MANAFMVSGLTKTYQDFVLDHVSFTVPNGSIVGLIGENGAGKSTTINAALGLIQKDDGVVSILDREELDENIKEQIGVVFDGSNYPEILSPRKLNRVMKNIYRTWDEQVYFGLLKQFSLPSNKQIKQFSKGMKMKLAISIAFSHHSRLLILDEATSGLDPVVRDIGISATLLAGGISLPCAYLFDPEKSQIVFMMSFMAGAGIITGLVLLINLVFPVKENILLAFGIVLIISVIWFFISYRIAVKVYQNRDIN